MIEVETLDNRVRNISYENAMDLIEGLSDRQRHDHGGVEIYSGKHPQHGEIYIVLPPVGGGILLLPFVIQ